MAEAQEFMRKVAARFRRIARRSAIRAWSRANRAVVARRRRFPVLRRLVDPELLRLETLAPRREVTVYRGRQVISTFSERATPWHLSAVAADHVVRALDQAGVEYFATHAPYTRVSRWAVRRKDLPALVKVLKDELGELGFYYALEGIERGSQLVLRGLTSRELEAVRSFTLFQYVRCSETGRLFGPPEGCDVAVWDEDEDGNLRSPDRDSIIQQIGAASAPELVERPRWDGRLERRLAASEHDAFSIEFPVDAVYLWVDDSDPRWREKREAVRLSLGMEPSPASTDESVAAHRFRDRGELRASMRSLEMYAPWIRNIYLVTDEQRPDWLDSEHGRVQVVDHRDIFADPRVLPSYNSHAISSQIHRIPGLADHYLLMNDDVMFNRPVTPYSFFTSTGQLRVNFSRSRRPDIPRESQTSLELARSNSAALLERDHGHRASSLFGHVPVPQSKDVALELEQRYGEEIRRTVASPFRAETDVVINSWLHLYTALFTGRAVRANIRFGYFNIGNTAVRQKMDRLEFVRKFQVICLNDVPPPGGEQEADPEWLAHWLQRVYPIRAPFEIEDEGPVARGA
ncbi:Stealth CR1 domain-containing protein [Isoptericola sp. NEAU-Y5]|uniref:Stealth CR1 domain-containing protein n=1 Tax=Isoptericola luteus TaxID=2879484 RepID=A0ABS7ZCT3_9MICO|nr:stealth conserved region 3 domain-containing protein [Isoptericola sp. NEAU-Y5]MCA5892723.1 Stealth CR1 domain-containing protein [Isoptericola sp. NEAU-Y5]